ncbi:GNAT family N-acetyltransferase [Pseudoalteromonas sp. McH1-7]|uniref:GNAT family N-acetyltransferase n=1 Tax=unclassified Pseudoalteromonas TaxID=194690 RepID=UPI000FFE8DD0|nr:MULTISPECIES: GNAT family N-acetyltransferase [unclassified Pseudoalteromonas]NUZ13158.1 GNAT family N-acetyltransferase [Pseudoalteromonas sp. McH1-7]RXF03161.1 N-acetyltransferase [Pseudoalteromonas sp. PS5]
MYNIERLAPIMTPLVNKFYDAHGARGRAAKHDLVWVVKDTTGIIAACRLQPVAEHWLLVGVYVSQSWRGRGIAKALITDALSQFQGTNPHSPVYTFAYTHLRSFYLTLGFCDKAQPLPDELASRLASYLGQNRQLVAMYYA